MFKACRLGAMVPFNTPYHLRSSERKRPDLVDGVRAARHPDKVITHYRCVTSPMATPNGRPVLLHRDAAFSSRDQRAGSQARSHGQESCDIDQRRWLHLLKVRAPPTFWWVGADKEDAYGALNVCLNNQARASTNDIHN